MWNNTINFFHLYLKGGKISRHRLPLKCESTTSFYIYQLLVSRQVLAASPCCSNLRSGSTRCQRCSAKVRLGLAATITGISRHLHSSTSLPSPDATWSHKAYIFTRDSRLFGQFGEIHSVWRNQNLFCPRMHWRVHWETVIQLPVYRHYSITNVLKVSSVMSQMVHTDCTQKVHALPFTWKLPVQSIPCVAWGRPVYLLWFSFRLNFYQPYFMKHN